MPTTSSLTGRFYGREEFRAILERYDIGVGDRFYDRPDAYAKDMAWNEVLKAPLRSLIVTYASKGSDGLIRYKIESWDLTSWSVSDEFGTTQNDFVELIATPHVKRPNTEARALIPNKKQSHKPLRIDQDQHGSNKSQASGCSLSAKCASEQGNSVKFNADAQPNFPFATQRKNNERKVIDQLVGFANGVLADGIVNDAEAVTFRSWISSLEKQNCGWPIDQIAERLDRIFHDKRISTEEREELAEIMQQIGGGNFDMECGEGAPRATTLPLDCPPPPIAFESATFCATGKFASGTRKQIEETIRAHGGEVRDSVTEDLSYLIVGEFSSRDWAHATYGLKIERAVEVRRKGHPLKIISEEHWRQTIGK